jgi:predicted nucleic-acid-binding protein
MNIIADTNVLVRVFVNDDPRQARIAEDTLAQASLVAVSLPCLCEFVWVLRGVYRFKRAQCAAAIRALLNANNVATNRPAAEAGLAMLDAGGDFADGVMAHEGAWLGGETVVSFDKQAVTLLTQQGRAARLL